MLTITEYFNILLHPVKNYQDFLKTKETSPNTYRDIVLIAATLVALTTYLYQFNYPANLFTFLTIAFFTTLVFIFKWLIFALFFMFFLKMFNIEIDINYKECLYLTSYSYLPVWLIPIILFTGKTAFTVWLKGFILAGFPVLLVFLILLYHYNIDFKKYSWFYLLVVVFKFFI